MSIHTASISARRRLRARRDLLTFERALRNASPSMQQELLVMAQRQNFVR